MTPKFSGQFIIYLPHNKKRGYPPSAHLLVRPTTALHADEQSDTHSKYCWYARKCAIKAWLAFTHTTGYTITAYPWHQTLRSLWHAIDCGSSTSQSTKHRVTLFHYVVSSPITPPTSMGIIVKRAVDFCKNTKKIAHCLCFYEKSS